jgi:His-Xaa-Ser system radical SAM maturase HxsB
MNLLTPLAVDPSAFARDKLAFFRYGLIPGIDPKVLITNEVAEWLLLKPEEFDRFYKGQLQPGEALETELASRGFLKNSLDLDDMTAKLRRKKAFLRSGPHLHVVITTLRCNQACRYCHASRTDMDRVDTDMSLETAKAVVDFAFQTPSPAVNFEFQGGEPTANFEAIQFIVEYALEKNRYENKELIFSLVTNMTLMTDEKVKFLLDHGVMICTSLDGPKDIHDHNRGLTGSKAGTYAQVDYWIDRINNEYIRRGLDPNLFHVDALMTTTRASLPHGRAIVDEYMRRGIKSIHLRPLNPFGFAVNTWKQIGYSMDEFLKFWRDAFDYILELNLQGTFLQERMSSVFLTRLLTPDDPNYTDCRSPVGSGTATLAYSYDGSIYTCDEGRMLGHMNNQTFKLGNVRSSSFKEVSTHPTVKAVALASITETLPGCSTCMFKPSCGIQPLHNFMFDGDLFGQRPRSRKCQEFYGQQQYLFQKLGQDKDGRIERIFRRWTIQRQRTGTIPYPSEV